MSKVVLINPPQLYLLTQFASFIVPPIGLAYLASFAKAKGHDVEIIDAFGSGLDQFTRQGDLNLRGLSFEEIIQQISPATDVIGIYNLFSHAYPMVRKLSQSIKETYADVPIIIGGVHPTALPEHVMQNTCFDYVVLGEGEETLVKLLEKIESGRDVDDIDGLAYRKDGEVIVNKKTKLIEDLDSLPFPAFEQLPIENYIQAKSPQGAWRGRFLPIIPTRGCNYKCKFCTAPKMWKPVWRTRSARNVADEMEYFHNRLKVTDFHFEDLTSVSNKEWIIELCKEIDKRGLKITWQLPNGTRSEIIDENITKRMRASGCTNITFAPESGSVEALELMNKKLDLENIFRASRLAAKGGMIVSAFLVMGVPGENVKSLKDTLKLLRKLARIGVHEVSITTFTALPGSEFFYELLQEGKIELSDNFFRDLLRMSDLLSAHSWLDGISNKQLNRYRLLGFFEFFAISFSMRPWRVLRSIWNLIRDKQETKVEKLVYEKISDAVGMIRRFFGKLKPTSPYRKLAD
jgi:radical SAM superfamily enzyme YgiQ (UPF0313 family)